jgi:hypothetical protein
MVFERKLLLRKNRDLKNHRREKTLSTIFVAQMFGGVSHQACEAVNVKLQQRFASTDKHTIRLRKIYGFYTFSSLFQRFYSIFPLDDLALRNFLLSEILKLKF